MLPWFPWWGWFLVLAAVPFAVLAWSLTRLHRWRETHHAWYGLALMLLGCWLVNTWPVPLGRLVAGWLVFLVGFWWLNDDAMAHYRQADDPNFPRSGPRAVLDRKYSAVHRIAHRLGLI